MLSSPSVANGIMRIFASDSDRRTSASSCLTVIGMVARLPVCRSILCVSDRIRTKWSFNLSAAVADSRGPHFIRQYLKRGRFEYFNVGRWVSRPGRSRMHGRASSECVGGRRVRSEWRRHQWTAVRET